jgi:metal-responsive CopG/Arc/MetJ family transcriptional regulator
MSKEKRSKRRNRIYLLLTHSEAEELERAAIESGSGSRSLIITEALTAGILTSNLKVSQQKRCKRIDAWIPHATAREFKLLAATHHVTQSHLLRHLLRQYLANPPWRNNQEPKTREAAAP